ncbi:MAG: FAD-dependent oxidoreductase [Acidobacteriota bacterium]|nr:FAD-dependent oxidoreductase [Acidobacteriota bacterium]
MNIPRRWRELVFALLAAQQLAAAARSFDVVVYGATAAGSIAALAAARNGATVALLEPGRFLGGMTTGGLGQTDFGKKETIGGYSLEFYQRVGRHYNHAVDWRFEPHVAEAVLRDMLESARVPVFFLHRLVEKTGVRKAEGRIQEIRLDNGGAFRAKVFIDATYEGDLMAQSGVSYTLGRESAQQYGESLAGVRPRDKNHQFDVPVAAFDAPGKLLAGIQSGPRGAIGAGDRKVQAYNFRLCLTDDPANQFAVPRPERYDARRYALLLRLINALTEQRRPPKLADLIYFGSLPNHKADINNRGAFSTDYIGKSWDYPEAGYKRRAQIWQDHIDYTAGFLYFLANDPRIPEPLRLEMRRWGLAKDEFLKTNHWPTQLYVREARRMTGEYVVTQKDIQTELLKDDSIGIGSYNSDSHNVQRYLEQDGTVQNEGNMEVPVRPYQIPFRALLPKRSQIRNLLVPVCLSASHVAYSTLRMEPVYMILGQAAGEAAALAARSGSAVQDVRITQLRDALIAHGAALGSH